MSAADPTPPKQRGRPFEPGVSPNPAGRPKGSRNKLGEAFLAALHADFTTNGADAIVKCREDNPAAYVKVIASLLPQQIEIKESAFDGLADGELEALVAAARQALGVAGEPEGRADQTGGDAQPDRVH